jgi:hypothetical protein
MHVQTISGLHSNPYAIYDLYKKQCKLPLKYSQHFTLPCTKHQKHYPLLYNITTQRKKPENSVYKLFIEEQDKIKIYSSLHLIKIPKISFTPATTDIIIITTSLQTVFALLSRVNDHTVYNAHLILFNFLQ